MRISAIAVAVSIALVGLSTADEARAAIKRTTNIPEQKLGPALRALAKDRNLQVLFRSQLVRDVRTTGAVGVLTTDEALSRLLSGTALTFQYLDDNTITIVSVAEANEGAALGGDAASRMENAGQRSLWDRFRLAQVDQGQTVLAQGQGELKRDAAGAEGAASPGAQTIDEIIVTAQRRKENLQDVPISISVLSGADLDTSTGGGLTEALNRVPGVTASVIPANGTSNVVVRGVSNGANVGAGSATTGYYLDAVPLEIGPDLSAYDLSRIEVLRGPQGTLYGVNSISGVVRVLTNDADLYDFAAKGRLTTSETSGGGTGYRGDAAINVPIVDGKLAARVVAGYEDVSGWLDRPNREDNNEGILRSYRIKVAASPVDQLRIGLSAWRADNDYDGTLAADPSGVRNVLFDEWLSLDTDLYAVTVSYDFPSFSISSSTSQYKGTRVGAKRSIFSESFFYNDYETETFSQEINLTSTGDSAFRWNLGGIYTKTEGKGFQRRGAYATLLTNTIVLDEKTESQPTAVFAQGHYRFANALELTLGLRYFEDDREAQRAPTAPLLKASFEATTPHVGLTWYASDNLTAYVSYGEGFRSGDLQNSGVPAEFSNPGPDTLHNYEVGAKGTAFDRRLSFDAALYYMEWDDIQQAIAIPFMGSFTTATFNSATASGYGFEGSVAFSPVEAFQLGLNFAWNDLTFEEDVLSGSNSTGFLVLFEKGSRINGSGEYTYGAFADYFFPLGGSGLQARLSASVNYQSELISRFLLEPDVVVINGDPMLIGRTSLSISPASDRWDVTLFVDNVTNEDGIVLGAWPVPAQVDEGTHVRPRTIGAQLEYKF